MSGLTINECACILCILGTPDPNDRTRRIYPTIEESLTYMSGASNHLIPGMVTEKTSNTNAVQLELFA